MNKKIKIAKTEYMTELKSTQHKRDANGRVIQNNMEKKKRKSSFASVGISALVLAVLMLGGLTYLSTTQNNRYSAIVDNQNRHIKLVETELREKKEILENTNNEYSGGVYTFPNTISESKKELKKADEVYAHGEDTTKPEEIFSTDQE